MSCTHDNLILEREGGRLPLEVRLGSEVDKVMFVAFQSGFPVVSECC